ncbi:MAG: hypothetical protein ACI855_000666, partial [Myxococcota bacterium]
DYATSSDVGQVQDSVDMIASDYATSSDVGQVQDSVDMIASDYATSSDVGQVQDSVDMIASDYVTSGELGSLQSDVDSITADYITGDIFSILEGDVDSISSDYLTSDDYIDLADQLEATASLVLLDSPQIIRLSCRASVSITNQAVSSVPDDASAIVANLYSFNSSRDDHVNHHFGRTTVAGTTWDNEPWNRNIRLSDVSITHQGDLAGDFYYGQGHGSNIIPLKANGTFDASLCRGYSRGTHYVTIQVNGYYR